MTQKSEEPRQSRRARGLYWLSIGPTMVFALLAVTVSWPLGPGYVDEGGITKLRLAVALIAIALIGGIGTLIRLVLDTARRLDDVSARLSQLVNQEERRHSGQMPPNQSLNPTGNRPAD